MNFSEHPDSLKRLSGADNTQFSFVVVSNRLPVDRFVGSDGVSAWQASPGGLVAALEPVMREQHGAWVGWTGVADDPAAALFVHDGIHIVPVALSADDLECYYEGFSNGTLWPLYHDVIAPPVYDRRWWESYRQVNQRFADAVSRSVAHNGTVWVHDYQLQLVPSMLRAQRPDVRIGFFNHIPFPAYGIFSQLPWRTQIIEGLLGADVIGFQRLADAGNFSRAVRRLLGYSTHGTQVDVPLYEEEQEKQPPKSARVSRRGISVRPVVAQHFPISIDVAACEALAKLPEVRARAREIRRELGDPKIVMLGVDRLDYTKGIGHRLQAYGELLAESQIGVTEVSLVQVASPSRERVATYVLLRDEVERTVSRINGDFGTISHTPIQYLHQVVSRKEMIALYLATDVMLVTALRDGMNLVAKEYVASRVDNDGVLVLSEFAGAADELTSALLVNPHDIEALKEVMVRAVNMPQRERSRRMRSLRRRVTEHDVAAWSRSFLACLGGQESGAKSE